MSNMFSNFRRIAVAALFTLSAAVALPVFAEEAQSTEQMLQAAASGAKDVRYTAIPRLRYRSTRQWKASSGAAVSSS